MRFVVACLALVGGAMAGANPTVTAEMPVFTSETVYGAYTLAETGSTIRVRQAGSAYVQGTYHTTSADGNWTADVEYSSRVDFIAELLNMYGNETLATSEPFSTNATQFTVGFTVSPCLDGTTVNYGYLATISPAAKSGDWIAIVPRLANGDLEPDEYTSFNYVTTDAITAMDYLTLDSSNAGEYALVYLTANDYIFVQSSSLAIATGVTTPCPTSSSSSSSAASSSSSSSSAGSSSSSSSSAGSSSSSSSAGSSSSSSAGSSSSSSAGSGSPSGSGSGSGNSSSTTDSDESESSSAGIVSAVFSVGLIAAALMF